MNNSVFQPLVVLEKKPISIKFEEVRLTFQKPGNDISEETMREENPQPKTFVQIIDRRKTSHIDRNAILIRLRDKMVVKNTLNIAMISVPIDDEIQLGEPEKRIIQQSEVVPIKTGQKLVIRPKISSDKNDENIVEKPIEEPIPEAIIEPKRLEEEVLVKPKRGRKPKAKGPIEPVPEVDLTTAVIRSQKVIDRLPKEKEKIIIKAPTYYMNNRKFFIQKLTELFKPYQKELLETQESVSCESRSQNDQFELLTHQKLVRDYLNLYTPYRGLLLYHNLGTGKSCTSIAIAEGMKSNKRVFVLTPASLKMNFFSEMKKCGDDIYKKNQFWEFVSIEGKPEYLGILSRALSIPVEYVRKHNGAWLVNITKDSNFTELETSQQLEIDAQLNEMIRSKYTDINYNGLNANKLNALTANNTKNPFDNSVVIIDEAHNFVSRIVNKIKKPNSISYILYDHLMNASNARIVLLSGTPIINYPNEIGILYNILRGYIKTWTIPAVWEKEEKLNTDTVLKMLDDGNLKTYDYVDYSDNKITITRNPFGFINTKKRGALKGTQKGRGQAGGGTRKNTINPKSFMEHFIEKKTFKKDEISENEDAMVQYNKNEELKDLYKGGAGEVFDRYNGVQLDDTGNLTDDDFLNRIQMILKNAKNGIKIRGSIELNKYKALPDNADDFLNMFVDTDSGNVKEIDLFQKRILGLTSYFRSAQEQLLPSFVKTPNGDIYQVVKCEMTQHQYGAYEKIRKEEADRDKSNKKAMRKQKAAGAVGEDIYNISSTYRIFSRACCNFAFPSDIERPMPNPRKDADGNEEEIDEIEFDAVPKALQQDVDIYSVGKDQEDINSIADDDESEDMKKYEKRIEKALSDLNKKTEGTNEHEYISKDALPTYSPKFAKVLENLTNPENDGLHLLYTHFRTIEGVGILRLILMANGYAEFKIQKTGENWDIIESVEDEGKPRFVLYTGTETAEEKEIIRNIYNGMWDFVPGNIVSKLKAKAENNNYGEVIKVFMITSSGAEGINLRNTRFVHIVEPYWHMVRVDQVVGRARRICSHQDLPDNKRTVKVFLYVSTFTEAQKNDDKNIELRLRDVSRLDKKTPVTTDESLYEIASVKQKINNQILRAIKESAVDCNIYSVLSKKDDPNSEKLICYGFGKVETNQFSSYPTLERDQSEKSGLDIKKINWTASKITIEGVVYAMNPGTKELYDFDSYQRHLDIGTQMILIGRLVTDGIGTKIVRV
jgi:hypothetical protein